MKNAFQLKMTSLLQTINEDEENDVSVDQHENSTEQEDLPSMKVLIQAYRKALLDGDENSVSEIEAAIRVIENEKNSLSLKFGELTAEISSGKARFLRLKADMENYRKRTEQDRLSLTSDVQGEVIVSLLPVVDSFEKAKQHLKPETEKEKKIETSYQGIYKQFVEIMRSLRVAVVGTVGKPFDPSVSKISETFFFSLPCRVICFSQAFYVAASLSFQFEQQRRIVRYQ